MSFTNFDQSTFLSHRSVDAVELGPPKPPKHFALPGAKTAVGHDHLVAYHEHGHDQHQIVARVNDRWRAEHADRLDAHARWVQGPYTHAIQQAREQQAQAAAEDMRRKARLEQLLAEDE